MKTTLLEGMTDVHTHLLPGVDDGFKTEQETLDMLQYMSDIGVRRVILTPHVSDELPGNTSEALLIRYERLKKQVPEKMTLCLAAEYMLDAEFRKRLSEGLLTLPGKHVLVETSYLAAPLDLLNLLYDLSLEGYIPVVAHPERYMYMTDSDYKNLKNKGYEFQLNLFSLTGFYGKQVCRKAIELLNLGYYDYVGSDCHNKELYESGLKSLYLSRSQLEELRLLIRNNNELV